VHLGRAPRTAKRALSIAMIPRLHERLGISAKMLVRPSRKSAAWAAITTGLGGPIKRANGGIWR
jgi:hypothetical protein